MIFLKIILNSIIYILSYINIFKCKLLNIKNSNYFVLKKTNGLIDPRSKRFSGLNKKKLSKSINFARSTSFSLSLKAIFTLSNIIIINSIHDQIFLKNKIFFIDQKFTQTLFHKKFLNLMKFLKIKKIDMIDDYRLMELFLPICKKLKIYSTGYMHGRISNDLKFQNALKKFTFFKYYVWNKYFKRKILSMNKNYMFNQIVIRNHLVKYKIKPIRKKEGLMIIEEDGINYKVYKKIIFSLKKMKNYSIYFKHRPNNKIDIKFKDFLTNQGIYSLHKENIYKSLKTYNIKGLIGFNSSLLIECSYYDVLPVVIINKKTEIKDLIRDGLFYTIDINSITKKLSNLKILKKKIYKIKNKAWY